MIICWERLKENHEKAQRVSTTSCQETFLRDLEIWTNKLHFRHENLETERDIWIEMYMHWEFCVIYGFMGFTISGNGGIE